MSTLSEISRAIQEIRQLLHTSLTPEFFSSVRNTCDAVSRVLNNPEVKDGLKGTLTQLNALLEDANRRGLVKEAVECLMEIKKALGEVDIQSCNQTIQSINTLLETAKEAQLLEHFVSALKAAKSVGELLELAKERMEGIGEFVSNYGVCVPVIAGALYGILLVSRGAPPPNYSEITDVTGAFLRIHQIRMKAVTNSNLIANNIRHDVYDSPEALREQREEKDYCDSLMRDIPRLTREEIYSLKILNVKFSNLISCFAEQEIKDGSLEDILGYIGENYQQYWEELLRYVVYSSQALPFGRAVKPELPHHGRNYFSLCGYYGKKYMHAIVTGLAEQFAQQGGNELYYVLANSFEDAPRAFIEFARYISAPREAQQNVRVAGVNTLREYYLNEAEQYIRNAWENTAWPIDLEDLGVQLGVDEIDANKTIKIIKARAFAEFCHKTSSYFFGLHYVVRDVGQGLLDIPRGAVHMVAHPIQTIQGVCGFFSWSGISNVGRSAWNRPWRFSAAMAPGLIAGGYGAARSLSPTAQVGSTAHSVHSLLPLSPSIGSQATSLSASSIINARSVVIASSSVGGVNEVIASSAAEEMNRVVASAEEEVAFVQENNAPRAGRASSGNVNRKRWHEVWFLLLPELENAKTALDFYAMLSKLSQQSEHDVAFPEICSSANFFRHSIFSPKVDSSCPELDASAAVPNNK